MNYGEQGHDDTADSSVRTPLNDVRDYMAGNYDQPLSIDELAQMAGLSPNYLGEAFKKAYGQSVMEYVTGLRIGQAKLLLRESDLYLRDIAHKVGYSDEFYFSRKFKKVVGVSPSAYSKEARQRIAVSSPAAIGNLLVLGILPVAAPIDPKWTPYYHYYYQAKIKVHLRAFGEEEQQDEDNIRKLQAAKPDMLIIQDELSGQMSKQLSLSGIQQLPLRAKDWKGQLREIAGELGRQTSCERWIRDYEARAEQARRSIQQSIGDEAFLVLRLCGQQLFLYSNRGICDVLYNDLALRTVDQQRNLCNEPISLEELQAINPQRLLLLICPDEETRKHWLTLQHQAQWKSLHAVASGHLYLIPSNPWFEYSAIAVHRMLEEATLMLTGKNPTDAPVSVHGGLPVLPL